MAEWTTAIVLDLGGANIKQVCMIVSTCLDFINMHMFNNVNLGG